jgi:hypothetical protein
LTVEISPERNKGRFFPAKRPQLLVAHFLIWMIAMALLLVARQDGYAQFFRILPPAVEEDWSRYAVGSSFFISLLDDAILALGVWGLTVGIQRRFRGENFFQHPGHWFLAEAGLIGVVAILVYHLKWVGIRVEDQLPNVGDDRVRASMAMAAMAVTQVVLYRIAMHNCREAGGRWDVVFASLSVQGLLKLLTATFLMLTVPYWRGQVLWWLPWQVTSRQLNDASVLMGFMPYCMFPVIATALVIALCGDRHLTGRDWTHWLGVAVGGWLTFWGLLGIVARLQFVMFWFS